VITDTVSTAFVVGVLLVAEDLRSTIGKEGPSSVAARRRALLAGALAGLAAATKYPAGAVFVVILVSLFTSGGASWARVRLAGLSAFSAVLSTLIAMPALVLRTRQVAAGLREQTHDYTSFSSTTSLFSQALDPQELGWLLTLAGFLGLVLLALRRESRPTVASWLAFGGLLLAPLLRYGFQPFRNALPLVPPLLIAAAAILFPASQRPSAVRTAIGGFGLLLVLVSFVPGWKWAYHDRVVRNSRTVFIDWLTTVARPNQRVLFVRELAFLPKELARVKATVVVAPYEETRALVEGGSFDALVYGKFDLAGTLPGEDAPVAQAQFEKWLETLKVEARFGSAPTPVTTGLWRGNDELILLAIRRDSGESLRRALPASATQ
jgi:hypothetical protein